METTNEVKVAEIMGKWSTAEKILVSSAMVAGTYALGCATLWFAGKSFDKMANAMSRIVKK